MKSAEEIGEEGFSESDAEKGDGEHDEDIGHAHDLAHFNPRHGGSDGFGATKIGGEVRGQAEEGEKRAEKNALGPAEQHSEGSGKVASGEAESA